MRKTLSALILACATAACSAGAVAPPEVAARWNHHPQSDDWNAAMLHALGSDGADMLALVPDDADQFCPGYASASPQARAEVWIAIFSGLSRYESSHNPRAAGAGGRYQGLMQIAPATARHHGCDTTAGLYDGATNLACAVRIASAAVTRDGVIASGRGGMAADWPPLRDAAKRGDISGFTRALPQCRAS